MDSRKLVFEVGTRLVSDLLSMVDLVPLFWPPWPMLVKHGIFGKEKYLYCKFLEIHIFDILLFRYKWGKSEVNSQKKKHDDGSPEKDQRSKTFWLTQSLLSGNMENKGNIRETEQKGQLLQNRLDGMLACSKAKALPSSPANQSNVVNFMLTIN